MTSLLKFFIASCAIVAAGFQAEARMCDSTPVGEIPFRVAADNRIYVTASVNGADSLRFLVDTGASSIVLNTNSPKLKGFIMPGEPIENLGTSGENTVEYSHSNSIKIGTVQYSDAGCAHIPYPPEYWDGVFGLNGLSAFNVEINYDDLTIYCYPKERPAREPSASVALPFIYKYSVPFVCMQAKIADTVYDLTLEIDTGSDRVIDLNTPFVSRHNLLQTKTPFAVSRISSSDNESGELLNVMFDQVIVGPYIMPRVAGAFSTLTSGMQSKEDIDGMIGNNFLKRFNMFIDFSDNIIYLEPNNLFYTPFYDFLVAT